MNNIDALNYLTKIVDEAKLTRQERDTAVMSIQLLHQVNTQFAQMNRERMAAAEAAKKAAAPKNPQTSTVMPEAPKQPIDTVDKSTA